MSSQGQRVAKLLRENEYRILDKWAAAAGQRLPAARQQAHEALLDSLPDFLENLADTLADSSPRSALAKREQELAIQHGRERAYMRDYDLKQIIDEYQILRQVIFDVLEEQAPLQRAERDLVLDAIQVASRNASAQFYHIHITRSELINRDIKRSMSELDKRAQQHAEELVRTRELLRVLVQSVEDYAIYTVDPQGIIQSWNQGAVLMKQFQPEEIIGKHLELLYPEDSRQRNEPMTHLKLAIERGRFRGEGIRKKKSGELFLADVSITPLYEGKNLIGFGKVVVDLTARTALIQERDLSRSKVVMLESERKLRENFIASLSHDVRTPLTAAKTCAELLDQKMADPSVLAPLPRKIIENISRADSMIQDFLDVNRIKAGHKLPLRLKKFDLFKTVRRSLDYLASIYGDRFVLKGDRKIEGYWDEQGIQRILENLCGNAIKYGAPDTLVSVTLKETHEQVQIAVHNAGKPIAPEEQDKLFEPFVRSQSADASDQPGWGIGLTLVRGVAEAHGGRVRLDSVEKSGTTFKVDLPRDSRSGQELFSTAV